MIKITKHKGWNFGIAYITGHKGKYLSIMFYKWNWFFCIGE
jgi:hypothetical protein